VSSPGTGTVPRVTITVLVPHEDGPALLGDLPGVTAVPYAVDAPLPAGAPRAEVLVPPFLTAGEAVALAERLPRLRLVQLLTAGAETFVDRLPDGVALSDCRGAHGGATAEWVVAALLGVYRHLPRFVHAQAEGRWDQHRTEELAGKRVLVVGAGDVAEHLVRRLAPFDVVTTLVGRRADGTVVARAWGPGAAWSLDRLPALLGADDTPEDFTCHHPLVADTHRRRGGLRFGRSGRVWDQVLPAVLEQKVTGTEARRSHRELCHRFGDPAPGPLAGLRLPPTPQQVRAIPDWEWHRAGVDHKRKRAVLSAAIVAHRLERACELGGEAGRELLRTVPGIGVWTAAEVAQRAWGDPDAVSFGDIHVPRLVGWALVGRPLDDAGMLEVLAPYRPQRQRAVRYIEVSDFRRPRFAPRFSPRDYRAM